MRFIEGVGYVDDTSYVVNQKTTTNAVSNADFKIALDEEADKLKQADTKMSLDAIFDEAAKKYNLPKELLTAVAYNESGFQPNVTSSAGAMGIMQLMPSTAKSYGVTDPYNPYQNIMGGAAVLNTLSHMYNGDLTLTLAGYSAGCGNVAKYGGVPPFAETQNYITRINNLIKNGVTVPDVTYDKNETTSIKEPVNGTSINLTASQNVAQSTNQSANDTRLSNKAEKALETSDIIAQIQQILRDILALTKSRNTKNDKETVNNILNTTNELVESGLNALTDAIKTNTNASEILSDILGNMQGLSITPESLDQVMTFTQYQFLMSHYTNMLDIISTLGTASILLSEKKDQDSLTDLYQLGNYQIAFNKASLNLRQPL